MTIVRSDFSLATALQNQLFGLVQPFVGAPGEGPVVWLANFAIMCGFG